MLQAPSLFFYVFLLLSLVLFFIFLISSGPRKAQPRTHPEPRPTSPRRERTCQVSGAHPERTRAPARAAVRADMGQRWAECFTHSLDGQIRWMMLSKGF